MQASSQMVFAPAALVIPGVTQQQLWAWHEAPGALERLMPPFDPAAVVSRSDPFRLKDGEVTLLVPLPVVGMLGCGLRLSARHNADNYVEGCQFQDTMSDGPFAEYAHTHIVSETSTPDTEVAAQLIDRIHFRLIGGCFGNALGGCVVHSKFRAMFKYRHAITRDDLSLHSRCQWQLKGMRIAVTGATGLIGSTLTPLLTTGGAQVVRMRRGRGAASEVQGGVSSAFWDPETGSVDVHELQGCQAVVHVAARGIAQAPYRWSAKAKREIWDSRVKGTRALCEALASMPRPPEVLVMASGVSYYGDTHGEALDENGDKGSGFLADLVQEWEAATEPASKAGIRVVFLRLGVVLSSAGGALRLMLPFFRAGLGGCLASGKQYMPWLSVDDAVGMIVHAICTPSLSGAVNAVGPQPATNAAFTRALARTLSRPALLPVPGCALRALLGQFAEETLLQDQNLVPKKLEQSGYKFRHSDVESALRHVLGKVF